MFASVSYGQIWSWNGGDLCRSSVLTVKEAHHILQIRLFGFASWRTVFSGFSRSWRGGMGRIWPWIIFSCVFQHTFSFKTVTKALRSWLWLFYNIIYGATRPLCVGTWSCPTSSLYIVFVQCNHYQPSKSTTWIFFKILAYKNKAAIDSRLKFGIKLQYKLYMELNYGMYIQMSTFMASENTALQNIRHI